MAGKEYEIAFRLGADLESSFVKTFSTASSDFKQLHSQILRLSKDKDAARMTKPVRDDLVRTRDALRNTSDATSNMMSIFKRAAATAGGLFAVNRLYNFGKDLVNTYAEFEQGLANVRAVSGATADEMRRLSEEARRLGATTAWSAKEVTDAEVLLAQAGFSVQETIDALPGLLNLASADQLDLAVATDIAAGTLRAFGLEAKEAARVADVLALSATATNSDVSGLGEAMKYVAPAAKALGLDVEQTAAAIGLLSNANIKGSQAGTVLRAGLSRLAAPTKAVQKQIDALGLKVFDSEGRMLSLDQVVENLNKSTANLTEQQRAAAIATIFGQEAMSGILALMEQGSDELRNLTNALYESDGAAKQMAEDRLDSLQGSFIILQSAIESAKIELGEKFAPYVRQVADYIANNLPAAVDKFEKKLPVLIKRGKQLIPVLTGIGASAAAIKVGKGAFDLITTISAIRKSAPAAALGMGSLTQAAAFLSNPLGIAATALGALTAGVIAYKRHQEKARQELIRMGKSLEEASKQYEAAFDKSKESKALIDEYESLRAIIDRTTDDTVDLTAEKERLAEVTARLQELFPESISQYEAENGLSRERVQLLREEADAELELARLRLEKEVASKDMFALGEEIKRLEEQTREYEKQQAAISALTDQVRSYEIQLKQASAAGDSARVSEIWREIQAASDQIAPGKSFKHIGQFLEYAEELREEMNKLREQQLTAQEELIEATKSYRDLYKAQIDLIEINLGGTLEEQAKKFAELSAEEQQRFMKALDSIEELHRLMDKLPTEKQINIDVLYGAAGMNPFERNFGIRQQSGSESIPFGGNFLPQFADGDIRTRPTVGIFAEKGPEALIPINNKPRSHALLDKVNQMMGHDRGGGNISVTFAPQISINGGGSDVQNQLTQALQRAQEEFEQRFKAMLRQERRLGYT